MLDVFDDSEIYINLTDDISDLNENLKSQKLDERKKELYKLLKKYNFKIPNNLDKHFFTHNFEIQVLFDNKEIKNGYGGSIYVRANRAKTGAHPPVILLSLNEFKKIILNFESDTYKNFVLNNDTAKYKERLNSLSIEELMEELLKVKAINKFIETKIKQIKKEKKDITKSIYIELHNKERESKDVDNIEQVINKIDELKKNTYSVYVRDIFLIDFEKPVIKKRKEELYSNDRDELISFLLQEHNIFHNDYKKGIYSIINIYNNIRFILYVITYLFKKYTNHLYTMSFIKFNWGDVIREVLTFYPEYCPEYLLGKKKKNGEYDDVSVLKRILYTLKLYDFDEIINHNVIPINYSNLKEVEEVTKILIEYGYKDIDNLSLCSLHNQNVNPVIINEVEVGRKSIKEIINDTDNKYSKYEKAIDAKTFLKNYKDIIVNFDFVKYNLLLKERSLCYKKS